MVSARAGLAAISANIVHPAGMFLSKVSVRDVPMVNNNDRTMMSPTHHLHKVVIGKIFKDHFIVHSPFFFIPLIALSLDPPHQRLNPLFKILLSNHHHLVPQRFQPLPLPLITRLDIIQKMQLTIHDDDHLQFVEKIRRRQEDAIVIVDDPNFRRVQGCANSERKVHECWTRLGKILIKLKRRGIPLLTITLSS